MDTKFAQTLDPKFDHAEELGLLRRALAEPVRQFILVEFDSIHRFRPVLDELVALAPERHAVILDFDFRRDRPADLLTTARSRLGVAGTEEIPLLVLLGVDAFEQDPAAPLAAAFWKAMNLAREAWDGLGTQLLLCLPIWSCRQAATHADHLLAWASLRIHLAAPPAPSGWLANEKPLPSVALLGDFGISPALARERLVELKQSWQQAGARSEDPSSFVRRFFIPMLEAALAAGDLPAAREARDAACSTALIPEEDQPRWHELNVALAIASHDLHLAEEHTRKLLELAEQKVSARIGETALTALGRQANFLEQTAHFDLAESLYRRFLATLELRYGPENPLIASCLNNLGLLLHTTGRSVEGEVLLRRALAVDERAFDPDHPNIAVRLNNLSNILLAAKRFGEAEILLRRALAIAERRFGTDHPSVAGYLNNLAQILLKTNRLAEAEPLMRRALLTIERSVGTDDPRVAGALNNLAQLLHSTSRLSEAEPLMRRALAIDERIFGPEHPNVARDLNNLAELLKDTGRIDQAEPLVRSALAIEERAFGPLHHNVARSLNNLALLLQATNRSPEAEALLKRALEISEKDFAANQPNDLTAALNNLALFLKSTNRLAEAEHHLRRALEIDEKILGMNHPTVAIRLNNLAQLLYDANRLDEAEPLQRRHLEIFLNFTQTTGHRHPHLNAAFNNYFAILTQMGDTPAQAQAKIAALAQSYGVSLG